MRREHEQPPALLEATSYMLHSFNVDILAHFLRRCGGHVEEFAHRHPGILCGAPCYLAGGGFTELWKRQAHIVNRNFTAAADGVEKEQAQPGPGKAAAAPRHALHRVAQSI